MLEDVIIWFMLYSVFGWMYETVFCSIRRGVLVKRGFLYGPYCPIYGCGAVLSLGLLGWTSDPLVLFFGGMVIAAPLEYATGALLERICHRKFWDYSNRPGNIKGRICPLGLMIFGAFSWLLVDFVQPVVTLATTQLTATQQGILAVVFLAGLLLDAACSALAQTSRDESIWSTWDRMRRVVVTGATAGLLMLPRRDKPAPVRSALFSGTELLSNALAHMRQLPTILRAIRK